MQIHLGLSKTLENDEPTNQPTGDHYILFSPEKMGSLALPSLYWQALSVARDYACPG
jgi:hypothetical protein